MHVVDIEIAILETNRLVQIIQQVSGSIESNNYMYVEALAFRSFYDVA